MKTIKKLLLTALLIIIAFAGFAQKVDKKQGSHEKRQKMDSAKIAFIKERLALSQSQSDKFFPLYKEFNGKRKSLRKEMSSLKYHSGNLSASDEQLRGDISKMFEIRQKEVDLDKEYYSKFQQVINIRQIAELYHAERLFAKELIKNLNERKQKSPDKE